jgi:hypothetical protein
MSFGGSRRGQNVGKQALLQLMHGCRAAGFQQLSCRSLSIVAARTGASLEHYQL